LRSAECGLRNVNSGVYILSSQTDGNILIMRDVECGLGSFEFMFLYSEIRILHSEFDKGVL
jgi:hypothetical protein